MNLPTGNYNATVNGQSSLNGQLTVGGTNSNPTVTYKSITASNVSWDQNAAKLTFTATIGGQGWNFAGTYASGGFTGTVNGPSITGGQYSWEADSSEEEETSAASAGRE